MNFLDRNLTSSDVEFLVEGPEAERKRNAKTTMKVKEKDSSHAMTHASFDKMLTTSDLSGLQADWDVDMNVMSVLLT